MKKVIIATPFYEVKGFANYIVSLAQSLMTLGRRDDISIAYCALTGDAYVDRARNSIAMSFLESDHTELVFIDSDMGWEVKDLLKLIQAEEDFIGAAYPCKNSWDFFGCYLKVNANGRPLMNVNGNYHAWNVPTGFCKIKKNILQRFMKARPEEWYWGQDPNDSHPIKIHDFFGKLKPNEVQEFPHRFWGEDTGFCLKLQAMGESLFIMPDCTLSHIGVDIRAGNLSEHISSGKAVRELSKKAFS